MRSFNESRLLCCTHFVLFLHKKNGFLYICSWLQQICVLSKWTLSLQASQIDDISHLKSFRFIKKKKKHLHLASNFISENKIVLLCQGLGLTYPTGQIHSKMCQINQTKWLASSWVVSMLIKKNNRHLATTDIYLKSRKRMFLKEPK